MIRENASDLLAFVAVAQERSFTRAAVKLGMSQSTLSHTIRKLEERLGLRLLSRTTRSVAVTEAGERLLNTIVPRFQEIEAELVSLRDLRAKPTGTIRLTMGEHAAHAIWARVSKLLESYPDIKVEISVDYGFKDIVAERYDAGIRLGEDIAKDMIAVPIGPDMRMAVVGSPRYFKRHSKPGSPQELTHHACINMRLPTHDTIYQWEFEKRGRTVRVGVDGPLVFNTLMLRVNAVLEGHGLAFVPEDVVLRHIADGKLVRVLEDWCKPFAGYHLYYTSRRQTTQAFALLVDALRYRP